MINELDSKSCDFWKSLNSNENFRVYCIPVYLVVNAEPQMPILLGIA
jgi:hypothetical protein